MTLRAGSAMRLASSWMVITSGMVTSRTSFSFGSATISFLRRWMRRLKAATECSGSSSALKAVTTVSRPRGFCCTVVRVGLGARTGRAGAPGRRGRGASSSSSGDHDRARARPGDGGRDFLAAEALLGDLVGLVLDLVVVPAALVFFALAGFGRERVRRARPRRAARGSWRPLRRSCVLPPRADGHRRARARGGCALRRSACAARRRMAWAAWRGVGAGAAAGRGRGGRGAPCRSPDAWRAPERAAARPRSWACPGVAAADLFDDHRLGPAMAEALAHHARLAAARFERQRLGRGDTQLLVASLFGRFSHSVPISRAFLAVGRDRPGPKSLKARRARQKRLAFGAGKQRSMYHI